MKLKYMLLALIPLCLAGCSEDENIIPDKPQREVRVTAGADAQSRIVLNDEGNRIRSYWQDGDRISLFTSTQSNLVYSTTIDKNMTTATFTPVGEALEDVDGNTVYACYPDITLASGENESVVVNLPSTETMDYNDGAIRSFGYAVGTISDGDVNFKFKYISAFLGLTVTPDSLSDATKAISRVTVTTTASEPLSVGEGDTFDFSTLTANTTNGSNTVQINVDNLFVDSLWTVYIPLLPQPAGAEITLTITDSEGTTLYTVTKPTPESGFQAGHVYKQGVYDKAYLIDGPTFNERIKELANENNEKIGHVKFMTGVQTLPSIYVKVSADDSPVPIYASFNETDSLITISTPAKDIEVVNAAEMFSFLPELRTIDFGNFHINETTTNTQMMFFRCYSLNSLDVSEWNTKNITNMLWMFFWCESLTSLDVSNWNLANTVNIHAMFDLCSSLTTLDVSQWNTANVTDMSSVFSGCNNLTSIDVSNWNTENVTNMSGVFSGCNNLTSIDVSNWNTENVNDMGSVFSGCNNLTSIDVSNWNTENVTNMSGVFSGCNNLTSIDVSNWNVANVQDMTYMFDGCSALTTLDVSQWNTASLNNPGAMFRDCSGLATINVSNWNMDNVHNIGEIFSGCSALTNVDVSHWNTANVSDMNKVFNGCSSLTALDLSNWSISNVGDMDDIFANCVNLTQLNISNWSFNEENTYWYSYMFDNCASTSQACKVTSTLATKEFLLARTDETGMNPEWFIWDGSSYNDMPNQDW